MSSLRDLLGKPLDQMSVEELEERMNLIKKMKVTDVKPSPNKADTSNKGKRLKDAFKGLSEDDVSELLKLMGGKKDD